ncbi:hypothetical protein BC830DRAFT_854703 [Chytriomyces sp. MP71]|nr:hypothetical protein BC830DRAFT_854703 [Chytriomyces sp. MP71]
MSTHSAASEAGDELRTLAEALPQAVTHPGPQLMSTSSSSSCAAGKGSRRCNPSHPNHADIVHLQASVARRLESNRVSQKAYRERKESTFREMERKLAIITEHFGNDDAREGNKSN